MSTRLPSANEYYALFGMVAEVGELMGIIAKSIRDQHLPEDVEAKAKKELGDCLWFIAAVAKDLGCTLEEIAIMNRDKLFSRKERGTLEGSGDNR